MRELAIVVALLLLYKYGRFLGKGHVATAVHNAHDVIGLERSLGVFTEARLQDLVVTDTALIRFLNAYYLIAHVAVTAAAFVWLYVRHPSTYRRFRDVMIVITITGMTLHLLLPLAPPRMFPHLGFVDTAKVFGPASYGAGSPYKGFANQFAAMPSLHFGWALVIAWAVLLATTSRWRYLVLAHPVITLAAIVLTANHYWLDAVAATVLFVFALGGRPSARASPDAADGGQRLGGRRNCCARLAKWSGVERATFHVPSSSTACAGTSIGCGAPGGQIPRLTSAAARSCGRCCVNPAVRRRGRRSPRRSPAGGGWPRRRR